MGAMTAPVTVAPKSGQATKLSTSAKVVSVVMLVLGSIVTILGLLLVNGSSSDSAMGRAFTDLGWIAAAIGLVHVVTAVLGLIGGWPGRVMMLLLGAIGCLAAVGTMSQGGAFSLVGLVIYGTVIAVFALAWRVPTGSPMPPEPA
jgi:hypothetical protein